MFIVYQPNLKAKSDADIIRDAKLAAMGLLPEEHEPRRQSERSQMATDEIVSIAILIPLSSCVYMFDLQVMERFKKRMRK